MKQVLVVRKESLPFRCEVCHQTDQFDPRTSRCLRCESVSLSPEKTTPSKERPDFITPGVWLIPSVFTLRHLTQVYAEGRHLGAFVLGLLALFFPLMAVLHWFSKRWCGFTPNHSGLFQAIGLTLFDILATIGFLAGYFQTVGLGDPGGVAQWTAILIGVFGFLGLTVFYWWDWYTRYQRQIKPSVLT